MIMITEEDLLTQFFIVVEQIPQIEVSHFFKGIYILLSLHYIFDMEYNSRLCGLYLFLEDKLLGLTTPSCKKKQPQILVLPQLLDAISPSKGTITDQLITLLLLLCLTIFYLSI